MPVYSLGALNTAALVTPGVYVQKVPPQTRYINGVPTNILGLVGVGSWGPVNSAVLAQGDTFGVVTFRKYDLATAISISSQIGANNVMAVRVSDGTDTAAIANLVDTAGSPGTGAVLTAIYTGIIGNTLSAVVAAGTANNTTKLTINRVGYVSEIFDNIPGTGATLWANIVSAVNNGQTGLRGPSQLCVATIGSSSVTPKQVAITLAGGTDGASGVTDTTMVGADGVSASSRTGLYALRGSGAQVVNIIDVTTYTQWPNIAAYADSEGAYIPVQGSAGQNYSTVSGNLVSAGVDDPSLKVLVGDWIYWQDNVNGVERLIAPATFVAAELANLSPEQSTLNKQLPAVVGTQRSAQQQPYSIAEIGAVATSRLDVVANPCPGGSYYGAQTGRNCSSDPTRNGDNYTRLTNFIALTLAGAFGFVIGQLQTENLRLQVSASMRSFLQTLVDQGMIGDVNGGPAYSVEIDAKNNPSSRVALGYMQANVQVKYLSIIWFFIVNLEGGQTVTVQQVGQQQS
jgi:Bacteriophage tail sheath protein